MIKFLFNSSLCPYYKYFWCQCKSSARNGDIHQVFCLANVVEINVNDYSQPIKMDHLGNILLFPEDHENIS